MRLLLFVGPIIVAGCFRITQQSKKGGVLLSFVWLAVFILSAAIGALLWKPTDENTRFASGMILAAPVLLLGPALLSLRSKPISLAVLCLLTVILPILSVVAAFFILSASHQVWGM